MKNKRFFNREYWCQDAASVSTKFTSCEKDMGNNMELQTCKKCKKLFYYLKGDCLCQECQKYMDEMFLHASQYISEHQDAEMAQVSADCHVPMSQIEEWIKEEKLHTIDEQKVYSVCEGCGKSIPMGNFCNLCKRQLIGGVKKALEIDRIQHAVHTPAKNSNSQMRFIHRERG